MKIRRYYCLFCIHVLDLSMTRLNGSFKTKTKKKKNTVYVFLFGAGEGVKLFILLVNNI